MTVWLLRGKKLWCFLMVFDPVFDPIFDLEYITNWRKQKDQFMLESPHSPLSSAQKINFSGQGNFLSYFEPHPEYAFSLEPMLHAVQRAVQISTSSGETRWYVCWGALEFALPQGVGTLQLYLAEPQETPKAFFIPFKDRSSGPLSYGAGRYLDAPFQGGRVLLDFNRAYHPFCAYSEGYSCPLPPPENWLELAILAGERNSILPIT